MKRLVLSYLGVVGLVALVATLADSAPLPPLRHGLENIASLPVGCTVGQQPNWSGSAWVCGSAGAGATISGTTNHVLKLTGPSTAGDSSTIDDGVRVTMPEPIRWPLTYGVSTVDTPIFEFLSSVEPVSSEADYALHSAEHRWTNEPGGVPYYDKDLFFGFNYPGHRVDTGHMANFLQIESKWWETNWAPAVMGNEFHLATEDTSGHLVRWLTHTTLDDNRGYTTLAATKYVFTDWSTANVWLQMEGSNISTYAVPVTIHSDDAQPFNVVAMTGGSPILVIGTPSTGSNLYTPLGITTTNPTPVTLVNPTGAVNLEMDATGGKTLDVSIQTNGEADYINSSTTGNGNVAFYGNGEKRFGNATDFVSRLVIDDAGPRTDYDVRLAMGSRVTWSGSIAANTAADTGLARADANTVEVNNGTAGTLRDFSARRVTTPQSISAGTSVFVNNTNINTRIGTSSGTPTVNHGTLSGDASNSFGRVTGVGSFTSVTITMGSPSFGSQVHCQVTPLSGSYVSPGYLLVVTPTTAAPVVSCLVSASTVSLGNCPDFEYQCWGT